MRNHTIRKTHKGGSDSLSRLYISSKAGHLGSGGYRIQDARMAFWIRRAAIQRLQAPTEGARASGPATIRILSHISGGMAFMDLCDYCTTLDYP